MEIDRFWLVGPDRAQRLHQAASVELEQQLETWLERDPDLLEPGLVVLGRQVSIKHQRRIDLLARTPQGEWVIVELKRAKAPVEALAQGMVYAAWLRKCPSDELAKLVQAYSRARTQRGLAPIPAELLADIGAETGPAKPRPLRLHIAGVGLSTELEEVAQDLRNQGTLVTVTSFGYYTGPDGVRLLSQRVTDPEIAMKRSSDVNLVLESATANGVNEHFAALREVGRRHGWLERGFYGTHRSTLMFRPPSGGSGCLVSIGTRARTPGIVEITIGAELVAQQYDVAEADAQAAFPGPSRGWTAMDLVQARDFGSKLDAFLQRTRLRQGDPTPHK